MDRRQQTAAAAERYRQMARDRKELKRGRLVPAVETVQLAERLVPGGRGGHRPPAARRLR